MSLGTTGTSLREVPGAVGVTGLIPPVTDSPSSPRSRGESPPVEETPGPQYIPTSPWEACTIRHGMVMSETSKYAPSVPTVTSVTPDGRLFDDASVTSPGLPKVNSCSERRPPSSPPDHAMSAPDGWLESASPHAPAAGLAAKVTIATTSGPRPERLRAWTISQLPECGGTGWVGRDCDIPHIWRQGGSTPGHTR